MPTALANALLASNSIFLILAIAAVLFRFIERRRSVIGLGKDDWLVLVSLFFATGLCLTNIIGVPVGKLGTPFPDLTAPESELFLKFSYAWQFFYLFAVAFVKFSILYFYRRIFYSSPTFLRAQKILVWVVAGWIVAFFFATLFQAIPFSCNWTPCTMSMDYPAMYLSSSVTDIALDIIILCMPLTMLSRLEMNVHKKIALTLIFGLGIFCVVASIARLAYTVSFRNSAEDDDFGVNFSDAAVNIVIWSGIEACASIICACLPCFGHYLARIPALQKLAFSPNTLKPRSPVYSSNPRFTGGSRDLNRGRHKKRLSTLSAIDTKVSYHKHYGSPGRGHWSGMGDAETSSVERMIATLPSPLMTPKIKGLPTHRNLHEPEIEMGRIHLRTGSEESVDPKTAFQEKEDV